jgi:hypothetical protein
MYKNSYKTSLSSPSSTRRTKSGLNSNKNKLLKDESKGLNNNNKDNMQLISHSSYWPANENVKRSQQQQQEQNADMSENSFYNTLDVNDFLQQQQQQPLSSGMDDVTYFEDDDDLDYVNGFFNSVNQDNINDFYFYINQLLSKKPNQKSI